MKSVDRRKPAIFHARLHGFLTVFLHEMRDRHSSFDGCNNLDFIMLLNLVSLLRNASILISIALCCVLTALAPAHAIIVVGGGTGTPGVHGTSGFILTNGNPIVDVSHPAYDNSPTAPNLPQSGWVWDPIGGTINAPITFEFDFDLTGFDPNSASLTGLWGVDNVATAFLNGHQIASLPNHLIANFNPMVSLNLAAGSGFFNAGINLLTFQAEDFGPPGAFRTAFLVDADEISAVPLPAGGPLLVLGLLGLAYLSRRQSGLA